MSKPRCQECGGAVKTTLNSGLEIIEWRCLSCGEISYPQKAARTRARKKFELIKVLMRRPVGWWENAEVGPHVSITYPMPDEAAIEADAILTELYGEMP